MKRIFTIAASILFAISAMAADEAQLKSEIKAANSAADKYSCDFKKEKVMKLLKTTVKSEGICYISGSDKMSMLYSEPEGDLLVIADGKFVMISNGKYRNLSTKQGSGTATLRNTLLKCMRGDIDGIAEETNSDVSYSSTGEGHEFVITRREKVKLGYSTVKLLFDKKTKLLKVMTLVEPTDVYTVYTIGSHSAAPFSADVFDIPKK